MFFLIKWMRVFVPASGQAQGVKSPFSALILNYPARSWGLTAYSFTMIGEGIDYAS
jgi:hypothetical protein